MQARTRNSLSDEWSIEGRAWTIKEIIESKVRTNVNGERSRRKLEWWVKVKYRAWIMKETDEVEGSAWQMREVEERAWMMSQWRKLKGLNWVKQTEEVNRLKNMDDKRSRWKCLMRKTRQNEREFRSREKNVDDEKSRRNWDWMMITVKYQEQPA